MRNKIAKFVKESVEWLVENQQGCCRYKLDDHLAVFVGWSKGYEETKQDDIIQANDELTYAITVGIKVWTSDDMWTDFDWLNFPYYENGDVLDMSFSIAPNENYEFAADSLLGWYDEVKELKLSRDGKILEEEN